MSHRFIRIYKKLDIHEIQKHLLIYGDISGACGNCQTIDLKLNTFQCPQCQTVYKYVAFRNIRDHLPKLQQLYDERSDLLCVDFDDFKRLSGALKAEEFLK